MDRQSEKGLTLIEMAIVLIIAGIIVGPAIGLYNLYQKNMDMRQTDEAISEAWRAIDGFRAMYGRYPCPAPMDAIRTSSAYGHEARDGSGNCDDSLAGISSAVSFRSALPAGDNEIFIGSLPFRQMNLREDLIHDGYGARLTYAVTGIQTDDTTYEAANGGITLVDEAGNFQTDPPHTAHVLVLSHGPRNSGAINRDGNRIAGPTACASASAAENENCDFDETFVVSQVSQNFDDLAVYTTSDQVGQWQISATDNQDIHLRRATNITSGVSESDPVTGFATTEIRGGGTSGTIRASAETGLPSSGRFSLEYLCDEAGVTNCFRPSLIAGQLADGEGMECSPAQPFMTGIAFNTALCTDEIRFSCPDPDDFIVGVDGDGHVVCDTVPSPPCPDDALGTVCGDTRTVSGFWESGTMYGYGYSGECYEIDPLDTAWLDAQTDLQDIRDYVDALNDTPRTASDCGPAAADALVRETFECRSDGTWNTSAIRQIERGSNGSPNLGHPPTSGGNVAEAPGPAYVPGTPRAVDPNNNQGNHDCWCREDYDVIEWACDGLATGTRFRIHRSVCPSTDNEWRPVYPGPGWTSDDRFCGCTPSSDTRTESCAAHFGYTGGGGGISGTVVIPYDITCPSGSTGDPVRVDGTPDISDCECPVNDPVTYDTTDCPTGQTNDFWYDGEHYEGVSQVRRREWVCPGGTPPQSATSAADAGYYTTTDVHNEACSCDTSLTTTHHENCPSGEMGAGIYYELPWNCSLGRYEDPDPAYITSEECYACVWQLGDGPYTDTVARPVEALSACSSCSGTSGCYRVGGSPGEFDVWDSCYCAGQP